MTDQDRIRQLDAEAEAAVNRKDYAQFFKICKEGAELDDARMKYNLGICYYNGLGTAADHRQALHWFAAAAEQESEDDSVALAAYKAGAMCYTGDGDGEKDLEVALFYYNIGALRGHAWSMYKLAWMYIKGEGTDDEKVHPALAVYWLNMASDELKEAQESLNNYTAYLEKNYPKAIDGKECMYAGDHLYEDKRFGGARMFYQKAAEHGYGYAQARLARMYREGEGTDKDLARALF